MHYRLVLAGNFLVIAINSRKAQKIKSEDHKLNHVESQFEQERYLCTIKKAEIYSTPDYTNCKIVPCRLFFLFFALLYENRNEKENGYIS